MMKYTKRIRTPIRLSSLLFVFGLLICTSHANSVVATQEHRVVNNTEKGLWDGARRISIEEDLIIGQEIGDESHMFGYVRGLVLDAQDNLYVADSYELNISAFDSDGGFIREFGREGQGPGELQTIDGMCWCPKDNNLYIADRRNHRITRFSPEGQPRGAVSDKLFRASIEGLRSLEDGRFVLTARSMGEGSTRFKLIVTDFALETVLAEQSVAFPSHTVGIKWAPKFSDVGAISGDKIYYTSPSAYEIMILDPGLNKILAVRKSHPEMFIPQYVQGFYADFNTIESLLELDDMYVIGVQNTPVKKIPRFKTKREFIEYTHTPNLREWGLQQAYQLDFYDKDFHFLGKVDIPANRRLAGKDSQNRLYFIEQEPYPRVVRCTLVLRPTQSSDNK